MDETVENRSRWWSEQDGSSDCGVAQWMRNESRAAAGSCSHRFRPVSSCWSLPCDWQLRTCLPHGCCEGEGVLSWQKHTRPVEPALPNALMMLEMKSYFYSFQNILRAASRCRGATRLLPVKLESIMFYFVFFFVFVYQFRVNELVLIGETDFTVLRIILFPHIP